MALKAVLIFSLPLATIVDQSPLLPLATAIAVFYLLT